MPLHPPVTGAPDIPGLSFRHYRGEEDLPRILDVINVAWPNAGLDLLQTLEGLRADYLNLSNCDPDRDLLIVEVDGTIVGYTRVTWDLEIAGPRRYFMIGWLRPEWLRCGIGAAMFDWNERRIAEIAAGQQRVQEETIGTIASDHMPGLRALLERRGYRPHGHDAEMVRPDLDGIPTAPLPAGLVVRTPREDEMRKVWEADVEAFRDHEGGSEPDEAGWQRFLAQPHDDPMLWRVAWDGDEVAGQVRSFINEEENEAYGRRRGYTEDISVRRPYRRRGLARALLVQSMHALRERGMTEAALSVHMENPAGALRLYESVGFRTVLVWTGYRTPLRLP